jgi:hypothetical protein
MVLCSSFMTWSMWWQHTNLLCVCSVTSRVPFSTGYRTHAQCGIIKIALYWILITLFIFFRFINYSNNITMFCLCNFLFSTSDFEWAVRLYWIWYKIKPMGLTRFSFPLIINNSTRDVEGCAVWSTFQPIGIIH